MGLSDVVGQDLALTLLRGALYRDRLGQAYLLVGPSGVGKQLTALALARTALCEAGEQDACERCQTCRRIRQGVHPDVRVFAPRDEGKRNLPVDYVRSEVLPFAKFAPFEAKRAFVIFPEADVSFPAEHPEAANALLKTLEEPRSHVCFVLTSERPDRLLSTIRARCQRVRFGRLPTEAVEQLLAARGFDEATRRSAAGLGGGQMDRALLLCDAERSRELLALRDVVATMASRVLGPRWLKAAAGRALVRLGDDLGVAALREVLTGLRGDGRSPAAQAVGELGLTQLDPVLVRLAGRPRGTDPVVLAEALAALLPASEAARAGLQRLARRTDVAGELARAALGGSAQEDEDRTVSL